MDELYAYIGSSLWMSIKYREAIMTCEVALIEDTMWNMEYSLIFNKNEQELRLAWDW